MKQLNLSLDTLNPDKYAYSIRIGNRDTHMSYSRVTEKQPEAVPDPQDGGVHSDYRREE